MNAFVVGPSFNPVSVVVEVGRRSKTLQYVIMTLTNGFEGISFDFVEEVPTAPWWKCKNS